MPPILAVARTEFAYLIPESREWWRREQPVDKTYESCFTPEVWPDVFEEMCRLPSRPGASLFISRSDASSAAQRRLTVWWAWLGVDRVGPI
jgi:hypothetical protein